MKTDPSWKTVLSECRAAERYAMDLPVVVTDSGHAGVVKAKVRDVSRRGIFIYLPVEVSGSKIEFAFELPADADAEQPAQVRCKATVVRVEASGEAGVGVAAKINSYRFVPSVRKA